MTRTLALLAAAAPLGACTGSLLRSELPAPVNYVLAPAAAPATLPQPLSVRLTIARPTMASGLDTDRIAVLKGQQLDYYRAARWGGGSVELLQRLLVDSLEDQHLFRSVTAEQARVASDYVLDVTVRDFQAEYTEGSAPIVNVRFSTRLIRVPDWQLVGAFAAQARSAAAADRMHAVAAAFEAATQQAVLDLAQQIALAAAGDAQGLREARGDTASHRPHEVEPAGSR